MLQRIFFTCTLAVLWATATLASPTFPSQPIKLVVGFAPGGSADQNGRLLAQHLSTRLNQQVIVENRPGASGTIASRYVAEARPDGYTLLYLTSASHAILPHILDVRYDPIKDFSPVIMVGKVGMVLIANPKLPVQSVDDLVALSTQKPGEIAYASPGIASSHHLAMTLLNLDTQTQMIHVPYKGSAPALNDVVAGQVPFMIDTISTSLPLILEGRLKPIAVTSGVRSPLLPNIPTIAESGVEGFDVDVWGGISAPRGTPSEIVDRLNRELNAILADPDVLQSFRAKGSEGGGGTPDRFAQFIEEESRKWQRVIQAANIRAD